METIADIVRRHAKLAPDSPAIVSEGQAPLTYAALSDLIDRVGIRLNAAGFGLGDRIATVGPNDAATAALVTGVMGCAAAVPTNPALTVGELAIYLRDQNVRAVAVDAALDTPVRKVAGELGLPLLEVERIDVGVTGMIDIRPGAGAGTAKRPGRPQADDLGMVLLTSGTTSHSKVVPITHGQLLIKIERLARAFQLTAADRCLNLMPLFHAHGLQAALGSTLYAGASVVMLPEFSVEAFFRTLKTMAPTWYTGSYTFHHRIHAAAPNYAATIKMVPLRFLRAASGQLDATIARELEAIFQAPVIQTYSSTEMSCVCCTPFPPAVRKPGTVGMSAGAEIGIMDPDKRLLPAGERGEIVARSGDIFSGYENDPAANAQCLADGWFRTGDEGVLDGDGVLTITGRIKDIINRGGEKITPSEVDDALSQHPDIANVVTFPIPHATLGQEVAAAVVPAKGADLTDEALAQFLRGRVAPFKVPRRFVIVDKIPTGHTGKVARQRLSEAFGLVTDAAVRHQRVESDRPATPLEARLQRAWAEVLGLDRVGLNEDFFILGGDSLQAVDLFLHIEKEIGRRLPRSVLFEAGTVAKMARRIEEAVASPCVVPIQANGDRPPFFCVHDGNGQVLNYRELSRFLGPEQPFYGIQSRGLDGEDEPFTRIEDMAAYYIQEIRKIQPAGPYFLGGYSFGGRVAYVMAQTLRAAGDEVALLALFDTYCHAGRQRVETRDWLAHHIERMRALRPTRIPAYLKQRTRNFVKMAYMRARLNSYSAAWHFYKARGKPLPRFLRLPVAANDMIRRNYRPRPYDGDATLFKCELYAWAHADQHEGWKKLIKGKLEIRPIPGGHYEIMDQPHVRTVAAGLAGAIERARAAHTTRVRGSTQVS
jgi:acyl-CoA synthetase (AMP-forming)/AMP-acid ligase II/thioesterase domain-containing protein/acyl carrier protein